MKFFRGSQTRHTLGTGGVGAWYGGGEKLQMDREDIHFVIGSRLKSFHEDENILCADVFKS